jgi:hypothetical protein
MLGLMHSPSSGNLLLYYNNEVLMIDFQVFRPTSYSFFIDEELLEVHIKQLNGNYIYHFNINEQIDTQNNRNKKNIAKKNALFTVLFFGIVFGFMFGLYHLGKYQNKQELINKGIETIAITDLRIGQKQHLRYQYGPQERPNFSRPVSFPLQKKLFAENGLPLLNGDAFIARYVPSRPENYKIYFDQPTASQLELYKMRARDKLLQQHPDMSPSEIACKVDIAYELKGLSGLSDILCLDLSPKDYPLHNSDSFLRLVRDIPFQQKAINCY